MYGNQQLVNDGPGKVTMRLRDVVELDGRGGWRGDPTHGRGHDYRLRMVKQGGQWRISHPPDRLLIPRAHFDSQYQQFLLYFMTKSARVLVPEPVYVPRGRQTPTMLVAGLLKGPGPRIERSLLPRGTSLDGISVPVSKNGTAEVPLSDDVREIDDGQLTMLYAQLAWTLGQVPGVRRVRVTVQGAPVDLPGSREDVAVDSWSEFDPSVGWASSALYGIRSGRVVTLGSGGEDNITGPLGTLSVGLRSIAVDLLAQHVAGVSADGSTVVDSNRDGVSGKAATRRDIRTVYAGGRDVLRPAYDLYGQLWVVDRRQSGVRLSVVRGGTARLVDTPGLTGMDVRRFVISRDGTRLVVQVRSHGRDKVFVARVLRDTKGRVRGIGRPSQLALAGAPDRIRDIGWRSPASVAVLFGATDASSQVEVVNIDGSSSTTDLGADPEVLRHRATRLVTSPAPGTSLLLETPDGKLYSLSRSGRWVASDVGAGLRAATYVG